MQMHPWVTLGILVSLVPCLSATGSRFIKEMVLEATNTTDDSLAVNVHSELPGNVTWTFTDDDTITIYVTTIADDVANINCVGVDFRSTSSHVTLFISDTRLIKIAAAVTGSGNTMYSGKIYNALLIFLVVYTFVRDWRGTVVTILMFCVLHETLLATVYGIEQQAGSIEDSVLVNIDIRAPRRRVYEEISLTSRNGNIRVDSPTENVTAFHCQTSMASEDGCPGCCHGNGRCRNNKCYCDEGYNGTTFCLLRKREDKLFTHFRDPRFVQTVLPSREIIDVYGKRKHNGSVTHISYMKLNLATETVRVDVDKNGQFKKLQSSTGVVVSVLKAPNCSILVTLNGVNGRDTLQHVLESGDCTNDSVEAAKVPQLFTTSVNPNASTNDSAGYMTGKRFHDIPIHVRQCGETNTKADVSVDIAVLGSRDVDSAILEMKASKRKKTDAYFLRLPNVKMKHSEMTSQRTCVGVVSHISRMCSSLKTLQIICNILLDSLSNSVNHATNGSHFSVICYKVSHILHNFCDKFLDEELKSSQECTRSFNVEIDTFAYSSFRLKAKAVLPNGRVLYGRPYEVDLQTPLSSTTDVLFIDDDRPQFKIKAITVIPEDPIPLDVYEVRLDYACATMFTVIKMNVTGSDQYTNHVTCKGVAECECCILHAAGARDAVVDKLTINVTDTLTNFSLIRQMVVVF